MPTGSGGGGTVSGWPVNTYLQGSNQTIFTVSGANQVDVWGFVLPYQARISTINMEINTSDVGHNYDFGIYNFSGTLLADTGPVAPASTGFVAFTIVQTAVTLSPGRYLFGFTGTSLTLVLLKSTINPSWVVATNVAASAGGQLPASITAQTIAPALGLISFAMY